jgi:hypothetical protein
LRSHASLVSFCQTRDTTSPFAPAQAGAQGQALERLQVWVPASAGTNGEGCSARVHLFNLATSLCVGSELQKCKRISAPVRMLRARGSPSFLSLRFPLRRGGWRADKAHDPGSPYELAWIGPGVRGSRAGPVRRALGVKRHAPRLAARQRGILAFMPLTVVGPGRLLVAGEAARAPPGDRGCVRPLLAGAAPVPRLQDAS